MRLRDRTTHVVIHRTELVTDDEYHGIVEPNGHIHFCIPHVMRGAHALEANAYSIGLAVFGNFAALERSYHPEPTEAQVLATAEFIRQCRWWYGNHLEVVTHSSLGLKGTRYPEKLIPGHDCPGTRGDLMGRLLRELAK